MLFKRENHLPMKERKELPRLTLAQRIQHILIFSTLLILALSGFPIKFAAAPWAELFNHTLGGVPITRIIHRVAGAIFFGTFLFHALIYLPYGFIKHCRMVRQSKGVCDFWDMFAFFYMIPDKKDLDDLIQDIKYWFFRADHKSPKRKFDYFGKFGYMAVFWGIPIVGPAGVIMWFKEYVFEFKIPIIGHLPADWLFTVVKIGHSDEVLLATIVLTIWHWYIVHYNPDVFPIRWTWLTGTCPAELLKEEHLLEYEKMMGQDKNNLLMKDNMSAPNIIHDGARKKVSFKEKLYTFLNINYKPKSRRYWLILAVPELVLLTFFLYITGTIMINHFYGYFNHNSHLSFPLTDWFVAKTAGMGAEDKANAYASKGDEEETSILLKELKEEIIFDKKAHFHNLLKDPTDEGKQPVCFYCHGNYPHKKQKMVRSLLNMHTQFLGCMTCHADGVPEENMALKWANYSGIQPKGEPFGIAYNPMTGALAETDDYYSKITIFVNGKMLEVPEDTLEAKEFIRIRGKLKPADQAKVKGKFHKNVGAKGRFCTRCHRTEDSFMPFEQLGFSEQRINDLTGLNVVSITQKYKEFYMPGVFKDINITPEKAKELLGKEEDKVKTEGLTDPRLWWLQKYSTSPAEDAPFAGPPTKK